MLSCRAKYIAQKVSLSVYVPDISKMEQPPSQNCDVLQIMGITLAFY